MSLNIKKVFIFIMMLLIIYSSVGCSSAKKVNKDTESELVEAVISNSDTSSDTDTTGTDSSPTSSSSVGSTASEAENSSVIVSDNTSSAIDKSQVTHILIDDKFLDGFKKSKYNYSVVLDDNVTSPPKVTAIQSDGSGTLKIIQAKNVSGSATVTLNGITYTIQFSKKDKSKVLNNTYYKLRKEKKLNIAYFGGSITAGFGATDSEKYSYRALTTAWFREKFPDADIMETNAAIGGTGTAFGIYRAVSDLKLESETENPDLVFIEFAINDLYDGTDTATAKANVEYIIRTIYKYVPDADIFIVLTTDQACMNKEFDLLKAHKSVAEAYNLPYLMVGAQLWNEMLAENNGQYPTKEIYSKYFTDTVHPANAGYAKYAGYLAAYLDEAFTAKASVPNSSVNSYMPSTSINNMPASPYTANFKGQTAVSGITIDSNGYITSGRAGTTFSFKFTGTDLKMWHWATAQGGRLSISIDGGTTKTVELYRVAANHKIVTIATGLKNTSHTVTVTLESSSYGSAMDIRYFLISGSESRSGVTLIN